MTPKKTINLSVIIPTYNGLHLLKDTLSQNREKLAHLNSVEWIISDDGSKDDTVPWLKSTYPDISVLTAPKNQGFAATVSAAARVAKGTFLFFLNNDMAIQSWDEALLMTAFQDPNCFAIVPQIIRPTKNNAFESFTWGKFEGGWFSAESYIPASQSITELSGKPILWACGGAMVVPRNKYEALGGFDTLYSPFYFEDLDLSYRAWKRGWTCHYHAFGAIHHQHQATIGNLFSQAQVDHIHKTHHYLFMWKNLDDIGFRLSHLLTIAIKLLTFQLKDSRAIFSALLRLPQVVSYRTQRPRPVLKDKEILENTKPR